MDDNGYNEGLQYSLHSQYSPSVTDEQYDDEDDDTSIANTFFSANVGSRADDKDVEHTFFHANLPNSNMPISEGKQFNDLDDYLTNNFDFAQVEVSGSPQQILTTTELLATPAPVSVHTPAPVPVHTPVPAPVHTPVYAPVHTLALPLPTPASRSPTPTTPTDPPVTHGTGQGAERNKARGKARGRVVHAHPSHQQAPSVAENVKNVKNVKNVDRGQRKQRKQRKPRPAGSPRPKQVKSINQKIYQQQKREEKQLRSIGITESASKHGEGYSTKVIDTNGNVQWYRVVAPKKIKATTDGGSDGGSAADSSSTTHYHKYWRKCNSRAQSSIPQQADHGDGLCSLKRKLKGGARGRGGVVGVVNNSLRGRSMRRALRDSTNNTHGTSSLAANSRRGAYRRGAYRRGAYSRRDRPSRAHSGCRWPSQAHSRCRWPIQAQIRAHSQSRPRQAVNSRRTAYSKQGRLRRSVNSRRTTYSRHGRRSRTVHRRRNTYSRRR